MEYNKKHKWGRIFAIAGVVYVSVVTILGINASSSSTAAIGYAFLPFIALIFGVIFGFAGFCLSWYFKFKYYKPLIAYFLLIPAIGIPGYFVYSELFSLSLCIRTTHIRNLDSISLNKLMKAPPQNKYLLAAVTENPDVSGDMLDTIAHINDPELYERQGTSWECINGSNRKGLAVMRLTALNTKVYATTLEYLAANTSNAYLLGDILRNPKVKEHTLRKIYHEYKGRQDSYLINWGIMYNPSAPSDILLELWNDPKNERDRDIIERNPNFQQRPYE